MYYTLPKIWQARIKKYWDRTIPGDFPASKSKFSLKYGTEEETEAVRTFEAELGTEESIVNDIIPEGTYFSGCLSVYDVTGQKNVKTLLSPEKVTTTDPFIVLHYEDSEWKEVEEVELIDGYVWGVIPGEEDGFSPVTVIFYKKDIEVATVDFFANPLLVANGNPINIYKNSNNHTVAENMNSGKKVDMSANNVAHVCAGTIDGSYVESTSVIVNKEVNNDKLVIYGGSAFYDAEDKTKHADVKNASITVLNSKIRGISAGLGCCRVDNFKVTMDGGNAFYVAAGQTSLKGGIDANGSMEVLGMTAPQYTNNVSMDIKNSEITWLYTGGNSGYTYTNNAESTLENCTITGGITAGGSNGRSDNVKYNISNTTAAFYISCNRGFVKNVDTKIKGSTIDKLSVFGDNDPDCTAYIEESVAIDIADGTYEIALGKNNDKAVEKADIDLVRYVKVSRSADYTISDADLNLLGDKFIVK